MLYFFLKNPFLSPRISVTNFDKLTKAHLAALAVANKDGSLSGIITDTQRLYDAFSRHLGEKSSSASLKKGQTETVESLVEAVKKYVAEQEPNVQYQFRKEPGKYAQFYPNGITEYRRAGKDELLTLFRRFTSTCLPHADKLGPEAVREAESLLDQLQNARNGQVHKKQTVKDLSGMAAAGQQELGVRLYRTLGLLISLHADQPEAINRFFDFSFLPKQAVKRVEEKAGVTA
jgi:hypothetical protein